MKSVYHNFIRISCETHQLNAPMTGEILCIAVGVWGPIRSRPNDRAKANQPEIDLPAGTTNDNMDFGSRIL